MSEAMSSVEIEDVLSSIRRLVSEDLRPGPRSMTKAEVARQEVAAKADEKLILTPAFRVVAEAEPVRPTPLRRLHLGAEPVARVVASTLERTVAAQSSEWESEVGDPPLLVGDMEWTEDGWAAPMPTAEVVQFIQPLSDATPSWAQVEPEAAEPDFTDAEAVDPAPITEPDRQWADQAEAEAVAQLEAQPAPSPDLRLDEQVLRDLVREMILEELQGNLGERITRNVRKLVRAEIARAISVHGVE